MTTKDPLLQPFKLRNLELKNRVVSMAHEPYYTVGGLPLERTLAYHEEKARGGMAMTFLGGSSVVDRDSPASFGNMVMWNDDIVPAFQKISERMHFYDCAVMCQITHMGRRSHWNKHDWLPNVAPSPIREPAHRSMPKEIEHHDIRRIVRAYGVAAKRCKDGGLNGIEIEAYGHLFDAFWSPRVNRRNDEYGGSLENRMRFSFEVLEEIRAQVGPDFIVGIRPVLDETVPEGIQLSEGLEIARRLEEHGAVDFFNIIRGLPDSDEGASHMIPTLGHVSAPHLEVAAQLKQQSNLPVMHAAGITDVATARHAIAEGKLDLVGMVRAHMADPHIVQKIMNGEEERIRPCVGAGYCINRIYGEGEALCIHNPATGRELSIPHVLQPTEKERKTAVVIGGGPSGMEAARVLAERAHKVTLFEAAAELGGQVRLASLLDRRKEIIGIVDWLQAECERLGVQIVTSTYAAEDDIRALNPDIVIVATGGMPDTSPLLGGEDCVINSWDILSGQVTPKGRGLLYDGVGGEAGLSCLEALCEHGLDIEYATPERQLAIEVGGHNYPAYFKSLYSSGVQITLNHRLERVSRTEDGMEAVFYNPYTYERITKTYDFVAWEHGTLPLDDLYHALKPFSANKGEIDLTALAEARAQPEPQNEGFLLYRIGDAVASRNIHAGMYDAIRICKDF